MSSVHSFHTFQQSISLLGDVKNEFLLQSLSSYERIEISGNGNSLLLDGLEIFKDYNLIDQIFSSELEHGPKIFLPRLSNTKSEVHPSPLSCLASALNSRSSHILAGLQTESISIDKIPEKEEVNYVRTLVVLGSVMLKSLENFKLPSHISKIVVIESDPVDLAIACKTCNLNQLVQTLRANDIGLQFVLEGDIVLLKQRLREQLLFLQPLSLNGLALIRSPIENSTLKLLQSWFRSPEGLTQDVANGFGGEVDELNQLFQASITASMEGNRFLLSPQDVQLDRTVILVASGPSLDAAIPWLQKYQDKLQIVASGSSLGVLLRNQIRPAAAVFLERSSVVRDNDLEELISDGFDLTNIPLIASMTVDPRIRALFGKTAWFHRPLSTTLALFPEEASSKLLQSGPQSSNAALEALLQLGYRKLFLIGCDFGASRRSYPRALDALGNTDRSLDMPVLGRHSKTVFSSPELISAAEYFANALKVYKAEVTSVAAGVALDGVVIDLIELDEHAARMHENPQPISTLIDNLSQSKVSSSELLQRFNLASEQCSRRFCQLIEIVKQSECWSLSFMRSLDAIIKFDESNMSSSEILVKRLCFYPIYASLQPLHDADAMSWQDKKEIVLGNLSWLLSVYKAYFQFLLLSVRDSAKSDYLFRWEDQVSLVWRHLES